jgi:hypothetical protein
LEKQGVSSKPIVPNAHRIGGQMVVTTDEIATRGGIDITTQRGEVGAFFQPIVEQERLIRESLSTETTPVSLYATKCFGHMIAVANIPAGRRWIDMMSRTERIRTKEVV